MGETEGREEQNTSRQLSTSDRTPTHKPTLADDEAGTSQLDEPSPTSMAQREEGDLSHARENNSSIDWIVLIVTALAMSFAMRAALDWTAQNPGERLGQGITLLTIPGAATLALGALLGLIEKARCQRWSRIASAVGGLGALLAVAMAAILTGLI